MLEQIQDLLSPFDEILDEPMSSYGALLSYEVLDFAEIVE